MLFESSSDCSTNEIKQQTFHLLPKVLRLKPHIRRLVDERQRALGLPSRYVAFQIRGGDKPGTEAVYMPPRAFLDGAMEALGGAEHASAFDTAFVMTDDFAMIEGVRDAVPGWRVATMAHEESHMAGKTGVGFDLWRETQLDGFVQFWAESELAASASAVVGSLSSNVGRWVKAMRHASAHRIEFHSVDPKDGIQALRNADVAAGAHACSEPSRRSSFAACSAPWYGVVVDVRAASPVRAGRLGAIGDDVLDLIDALSVLLAADVPFRLASNCSASSDDWKSDWSCAFSPNRETCPATRVMEASAIRHAAATPEGLSHLYKKLGVRRRVPASDEEHVLRACLAVSLTPFALGYGHMISYCSRMQLRRVILRRYLCLRPDVRKEVERLKTQLTQPWIDKGKRPFLEAKATQGLLPKQHLYDAIQMERRHLHQASNYSLGASMMHALYRSLQRAPYYGPSGRATSPRQQDFGLFVFADDELDVSGVHKSAGGFPSTFYARYIVGVNFVEDPVLTDPWREEVLSDRDAFVHLWASVELAANARWLFTTEGSKMGALVEAVREPSEREPATRVVAREAASER